MREEGDGGRNQPTGTKMYYSRCNEATAQTMERDSRFLHSGIRLIAVLRNEEEEGSVRRGNLHDSVKRYSTLYVETSCMSSYIIVNGMMYFFVLATHCAGA